MTTNPGLVPEQAEFVAAFDAEFRQSEAQVRDYTQAFRARYASQQVTTLEGTGWPLRPLFLSAATLSFVGRAIFEAFSVLTSDLLEKAADLDWLCEQIPIDRRIFESLAFAESLASPNFLSILRPDGFLDTECFRMTEVNFGNGTIVSNAYSEVLYDYFVHSPVFQNLGWDLSKGIERPFLHYLQLVKRSLPADRDAPFVALLAHHWEHQVILGWEARVIQALYWAQKMFRDEGIETRLLHEDEIYVDESGVARTRPDDRQVDCVLQVTIGTSFMDEPERLTADLSALRGPTVGQAPFIKPLASLCMDKGTMPYFTKLPIWPLRDENGFRFELAPTRFPLPEQAVTYRLQKQDYVLKRAFDGKDTHIGITAHGRVWNRVLEQALASRDYVLQEYCPLPRTVMPVFVDGERLEWIPVRVELSPFVIGGRFAGAIARYAPDAEGLILSPPPPGMGLTTVFGF